MQPHSSLPRQAAGQPTQRYAKCIETSKRIRWDIDRDVIRGRKFDFDKKFMPDGLSKINELTFLRPADARFLSQIQGRDVRQHVRAGGSLRRRQDA